MKKILAVSCIILFGLLGNAIAEQSMDGAEEAYMKFRKLTQRGDYKNAFDMLDEIADDWEIKGIFNYTKVLTDYDFWYYLFKTVL